MAPISWTGLGCYKEDGPAQNQVLLVLSISQLLWLRVVGLIGTPFVERVWQAVDKHPTQT